MSGMRQEGVIPLKNLRTEEKTSDDNCVDDETRQTRCESTASLYPHGGAYSEMIP